MTTTLARIPTPLELKDLNAHRDLEMNRAKLETEYREARALCPDRPRWDFVDRLTEKLRGHSEGRTFDQHLAELRQWDAQHPEAARKLSSLEGSIRVLDEMIASLAQKVAMIRAMEAALATVREALSAVPRVVAAIEQGHLQPTNALRTVQAFDSKPSTIWCLLLGGVVGTGKSTAAGVLAYEYARRGFRIAWLRASEAARTLFGEEADRRFALWRTAKLLVIDDLGTEMVTPAWQQSIDELLDYRWQHSLRTIITTNIKPETFKENYGARVARRIRDDGMVFALDESETFKRTTIRPELEASK